MSSPLSNLLGAKRPRDLGMQDYQQTDDNRDEKEDDGGERKVRSMRSSFQGSTSQFPQFAGSINFGLSPGLGLGLGLGIGGGSSSSSSSVDFGENLRWRCTPGLLAGRCDAYNISALDERKDGGMVKGDYRSLQECQSSCGILPSDPLSQMFSMLGQEDMKSLQQAAFGAKALSPELQQVEKEAFEADLIEKQIEGLLKLGWKNGDSKLNYGNYKANSETGRIAVDMVEGVAGMIRRGYGKLFSERISHFVAIKYAYFKAKFADIEVKEDYEEDDEDDEEDDDDDDEEKEEKKSTPVVQRSVERYYEVNRGSNSRENHWSVHRKLNPIITAMLLTKGWKISNADRLLFLTIWHGRTDDEDSKFVPGYEEKLHDEEKKDKVRWLNLGLLKTLNPTNRHDQELVINRLVRSKDQEGEFVDGVLWTWSILIPYAANYNFSATGNEAVVTYLWNPSSESVAQIKRLWSLLAGLPDPSNPSLSSSSSSSFFTQSRVSPSLPSIPLTVGVEETTIRSPILLRLQAERDPRETRSNEFTHLFQTAFDRRLNEYKNISTSEIIPELKEILAKETEWWGTRTPSDEDAKVNLERLIDARDALIILLSQPYFQQDDNSRAIYNDPQLAGLLALPV